MPSEKSAARLSNPTLLAAVLTVVSTLVSASASAQPVINEFVRDHTGTDVNEFVEIFGSPSTDYSAYTLVEVEGDLGSTGVIDDGVYPIGTTDANGIFVTPFVSNVFENGTLTLLLVQDYTGSLGDDIDTNDDGIIDFAPWNSIADAVGVPDSSSDLTYSSVNLPPGFDGNSFEVGGASRIPNGIDTNTAADWVRNNYDGEGLPCCLGSAAPGEAVNTPGAPNRTQLVINEFVRDHTGTDMNEFVEISGSPSTDYSAYTLVEVEGDLGSAGLIDDGVYAIGTTDANGIWATPYVSNVFENGTLTLLLVKDYTGSLGVDIDTNDDGVIDFAPWTSIADAVGVPDSLSDLTYSSVNLVPGFDGDPFQVGGASRIPNGINTSSAADWVRNSFNGGGLPCCLGSAAPGEAVNTRGAPNRAACGSVIISNSTFDISRTFQVCGDLVVGPNVHLIPPGVFGFFAGETVSFVGDFDTSAELRVGSCGRNLCSTGPAFEAGCMPCLTDVCSVDSYCCTTLWDRICVGLVETICGLDCS